MQNRIRASRCSQVNGKSRKDQTSCFRFRKLGFTLLALVLSSCATQKIESLPPSFKDQNLFLKENLNKICFTSEGKGRLVFLSERHSFSYEALLENKLYTWSLAIDIPMLGEELFRLHYKNAFEEKILAQGNFYDRLRLSAQSQKQDQYYLDVLNSYLVGVGKFLLIKDLLNDTKVLENSCPKRSDFLLEGSCHFKELQGPVDWVYHKNKVFSLKFPLYSEADFVIEAQELEKNHFTELKMKLKEKSNQGNVSKPMEIDLALSSCEGS